VEPASPAGAIWNQPICNGLESAVADETSATKRLKTLQPGVMVPELSVRRRATSPGLIARDQIARVVQASKKFREAQHDKLKVCIRGEKSNPPLCKGTFATVGADRSPQDGPTFHVSSPISPAGFTALAESRRSRRDPAPHIFTDP
jgi:CDGSH-type Zn-finger protein